MARCAISLRRCALCEVTWRAGVVTYEEWHYEGPDAVADAEADGAADAAADAAAEAEEEAEEGEERVSGAGAPEPEPARRGKGRRSTAVLRMAEAESAATGGGYHGLEWVHVHETWI